VDLKRPGRLDVHIPLFPPQTNEEVQALFMSMAKKVGLPITPEDVPPLQEGLELGGNEIEALMVRAQRLACLEGEARLAEKLAQVLTEYRPLPHKKILEYMDLQAVKECTDVGFLPPKFRELPAEQVEQRLEQLKMQLGIAR